MAFPSVLSNENINLNPSHKISFRGIKRQNDRVLV
jgi:hypothetical protein